MELKESDLRKEFLGTWMPRLVCAVEEISKHLKTLTDQNCMRSIQTAMSFSARPQSAMYNALSPVSIIKNEQEAEK